MKFDHHHHKAIRSYAGIIAMAVVLGFLAQFQIVGTVLIFAYAVFSLIKRIPSRSTFILAIISLTLTAILLFMGRRSIAENFAAYGFLLLIVAAIALCLEQWQLSKVLRKKHQKS